MNASEMLKGLDLSSLAPQPKKKVLLRAPVLTQSGYGVHSRQVARWLLGRHDVELEVQALPWGDTPWLINPDLHAGLVGRLMERTVDPSGRYYDATVQLQLPNEWDPNLSKVNIGITAGVETDRCNPAWVSACNAMSMVIVPSKHAASCLTNTAQVTSKLVVVPEAYTDAIKEKAHTTVDDLGLSTSFNFLVFGQLTGNNPENDRKNIFYTIKWLCETFKNDEDVGIVVKTNAGRNTTIDRKLINNTFRTIVGEAKKGPFPKIYLLHGDMSDAEVASLYRHPKVKALVTLTRGEGYGLPILEAAAAGLPVIATGWSGHMDFLSHGKFIDVAYKLEDVHQSRIDGAIFVPGSKWAAPIEDDFKRKVTKFRTASTIPREWAASLAEVIGKKYSQEAIAASYEEATRGIL